MTPTRIPHDGSACPVSPGTRVEAEFRDGERKIDLAGTWADADDSVWDCWQHNTTPPSAHEIVAYAILEPDWAVEGPKLAEALEPFAEIAQQYERAHHSQLQHFTDEVMRGPPPHPDSHRVSVSLGDLRRARTALSRIKQGD